MEAVYSNKTKIVARVGDVVMAPGNIRGIVIALEGTFVKVLAIGTSKDTGNTGVLPERYVHSFPANDCHYLDKQTLNL